MTKKLRLNMASPSETPVRVLVINPNTSTHMTDALKPVINELGFKNVCYTPAKSALSYTCST